VVLLTRLDSRTLASAVEEEEAGEQVAEEVVMERQVLGLDFQDNIRLRWEKLGPGKREREWEFVSERKIGAVRMEHIADHICRDLVQWVVDQDVNSLKMRNDTSGTVNEEGRAMVAEMVVTVEMRFEGMGTRADLGKGHH
jgi:hypothetical protein